MPYQKKTLQKSGKQIQSSHQSTMNMIRRVSPPRQLASDQNPNFKLSIQQIYLIFSQYLAWDRVWVTGGSVFKSYIDLEMNKEHRRSFGDIDINFPLCTKEEISSLWAYLRRYKSHDGYVEQLPASLLVQTFNELFNAGAELKSFYFKQESTTRYLVYINWYGVSLDCVLFEESLEKHAANLDISASAGFYNPYSAYIYFPCDEWINYSSGYPVAYDRSAIDIKNKEINLLYPASFVRTFDEDATRLLHVIRALCSSDFTLAKQLERDIHYYVRLRKHGVFSAINPDRLYFHLVRLFCTGHAVKHLNLLLKFQLFEELFCYVRELPEPLKARTLYLVQRAAQEHDDDVALWPSMFLYAVHWQSIKNETYSYQRIYELSGGTIRLPFNKANERDVLNESMHQTNMECLTRWQEEYDFDVSMEQSLVKMLKESETNQSLKPSASACLDNSPSDAQHEHLDNQQTLSSATCLDTLRTVWYTIPEETKEDVDPEPKRARDWFLEGQTCSQPQEALSCYKKALAIHPQHLLSLTASVQIQKELNKHAQVIKLCSDMLRIDQNKYFHQKPALSNETHQQFKYKTYCERANAYLKTEKYQKSCEDYRAAISCCPELPDAYYHLGDVTERLAQRESNSKDGFELYLKAVDYYEQALARTPNHRNARQRLNELSHTLKSEKFAKWQPKKSSKKSPKTNNIVPFWREKSGVSSFQHHEDNAIKPPRFWLEAEKEATALHYQKAIDLYIKCFTSIKDIQAMHACVTLYMKLKKPNEALKYLNRLADMSPQDYERRYQKMPQEKPFNQYAYHHAFARYQRGKFYSESAQYHMAVIDFEASINMLRIEKNDPCIMLKIDTFIQHGRAIYKLSKIENDALIVNELREKSTWGSKQFRDASTVIHQLSFEKSAVAAKENLAKQYYEQAEQLLSQQTLNEPQRLLAIYLGLGKIAQAQNSLTGEKSATEYYTKALQVILDHIASQYYPSDEAIYEALFQCAEYISGSFIEGMTEFVLQKANYVIKESDLFCLDIAYSIYLKSIEYTPQIIRAAHIQLIKIDLAREYYDAALIKIQRIVAEPLNKSQSSQRELFLLMGLCYEHKAQEELALEQYVKAAASRYSDDTAQHQMWLNAGNIAICRMNQTIKEKNTFAEAPFDKSQWMSTAFEKLREGQYQELLALCDKEIRKNPNNIMVYQQQIQVHILLKEGMAGLKICNHLLSIPESAFSDSTFIFNEPYHIYENHRYHIYELMGKCHLLNQNDEESLACFTRVTQYYEENIANESMERLAERCYMGLGHLYQKRIDCDESLSMPERIVRAKACYLRAIDISSNLSFPDYEAYQFLIRLEASYGSIQLALRYYVSYQERLKTFLQQYPEVQAEMIYELFNNWAETISGALINQTMDEVLGLRSDDVEQIVDKDHTLLMQSRSIYQYAVDYLSDHGIYTLQKAHLRLAFIAFITGELDESLERFLALLHAQESHAICSKRTLIYWCARLYDLKNDDANAKRYYQQSGTSKAYDDDDGYRTKSIINASKTSLRDIITKDLDRMRAAPKQYTSDEWFEKGEARRQADEYQNASDAYSKALAINPRHLEARRARISVDALLKQYNRVLPNCDYLISISEEEYLRAYAPTQAAPFNQYDYHCAQAHYERAMAYFYMNDYSKSLKDFVFLVERFKGTTNQFIGPVLLKVQKMLFRMRDNLSLFQRAVGQVDNMVSDDNQSRLT